MRKPDRPAPAVWFPAIRAGSGADVFTERLVDGLLARGLRAEITWLPHRAEYMPWSVPSPPAPPWANIVHVNSWLHPRFIPTRLPMVASMLHSVHDPALMPYKTLPQRLYHRLWVKPVERAILRQADRVIAISRYTAARTHDVFGIDDIDVIPIGIDLNGPFQPIPSPVMRHRPFRLLYIGNWSARKGADLLAPIMRNLGEEYELWLRTGLRDREFASLPPNMKQIPHCEGDEALAQLYHQCDALLFPSRLEGFGMVALEAQACGLPVIATNGSALPEVVEDGVTGLLCTFGAIEEFAHAARRLAADGELFLALRNAAGKHAAKHLDLPRMIDRYIAVYESILAR
ncbi:glycosyltransferase family 4 protein [Acidihalobacter yilgarnensis]|nr:glycosyltransferase family 4 protein [Acidihalobacter yilgarnensis]